jgi:glycosyltransferase involved in cell wall biosynthesis
MARKPNVLIMVDSFDMGGAEGQAVLLARLLLEDGRYGVHLACLKREGVLLEDAEALGVGEIPEYRLTSFFDWNMIVQLRRLAAFLREREIDVVHPQSFYTNVFGITGSALAGVPVRIAFRGEITGWRTPAQNFVERCAFRLATAIHANSDAVKRYLIESGVTARKIITVHNGLDTARVTPSPGVRREEVLARLDLPVDEKRCFVTIVANMRHEVKGHPMFLRAAARVRKDVPEAAFVLAGEGELRKNLRALAAQLGIEHDTFFIGRCENVAELLFISDVCVLSSKAEGFSNSILEYMAAARPVVATDVGGAREAIVEGETGYLVASGDAEAMAARIVSLLSNPKQARAMGQRGRRVVEERFSAKAQLENTRAMYDRLLAGPMLNVQADANALDESIKFRS